jgi:hypothetical protein
MTGPRALRFLSLAMLVWLCHARPSAAQAGGPTAVDKLKNLRAMLNETIDMKDFQAPMSLKEALGLIQDKLNEKYNRKDALPILVDAEAFQEGPEPLEADVYETPVKFPPFPRQMSVQTALKMTLSKIPRGATFLLRNGFVEVTTPKRASREQLLRQTFLANFERRPLIEALQEISALTGVSVTADTRLGEKLKVPVTAAFNNDTTLEAALRVLADMAELKLALADGAVYITTAANATTLEEEARARREQRRKEKAEEGEQPPGAPMSAQ